MTWERRHRDPGQDFSESENSGTFAFYSPIGILLPPFEVVKGAKGKQICKLPRAKIGRTSRPIP
jgi:hypothetical protein